MTNQAIETPTPQHQNLDAELATAFETKPVTPQVEGEQQQVGQTSVEPSSDPSRPDPETPSSRTGDTPSRTELLSSLTWDEVSGLEHLKPAIKSAADQEAARQLKGKTKEIEDRVRQETTQDYWKKHFDSMDAGDLADLIQKDPEARRLYAVVNTPVSPLPAQDGSSIVNYYTKVISATNDRVMSLPAESQARLDPSVYLKAFPDLQPEELLAKWQGEIAAEEVKALVAKQTNDSLEKESKVLDQSVETPRGALITPGKTTTGVLPDFGTRSDLLLADAFERTQVKSRS